MLDVDTIEEVWDLLAQSRKQFIESFYANFFDQFPDYKQYFPDCMDQQMERMMDLVSSLARFSNHIDLIRPYLLEVGDAHKEMVLLTKQDLCNFRDVFIKTAAETCGSDWEERHSIALHDAFDETIIPIVHEGMRGINRDS